MLSPNPQSPCIQDEALGGGWIVRVEPSWRAWCPRQRDPTAQSALAPYAPGTREAESTNREAGRHWHRVRRRPDTDWTSSLQDCEKNAVRKPPSLRGSVTAARRDEDDEVTDYGTAFSKLTLKNVLH